MADVKIRILGENQAKGTLSEVDGQLSGMKSALSGLSDAALKVTGAVVGVGAAMNQAFAIGEQGAAVIQTQQSFDQLNTQLGITPGLLDRLREASRGTVDDMTLMSSTMTLAAGGEKELATALIEATPRLLEIAKAANTLNPSLGDTAFQFDSIALGIKRGSPMILDNLGLTIKIEDAYNKYAATLGKTSQELTIEEQKLAILNATLTAGNTLITQVGGSTQSATDDFARLEASTDNLTNKFKVALVPVLAEAAGALELMVTWSARIDAANNEAAKNIFAQSQSYTEYAKTIAGVIEKQGYGVKVTEDQIQVFGRNSGGVVDLTDRFNVLDATTFNAMKTAQEMTTTYEGVAGANANLNASVGAAVAAISGEEAATEEATKAAVSMSEALDAMGVMSLGEFGAAAEAARAPLGKLKADVDLLSAAIAAIPTNVSVNFSSAGLESLAGVAATAGIQAVPQNAAVPPGGGSVQYIINYSPTLSTASAFEIQQILTPIVQGIVSGTP